MTCMVPGLKALRQGRGISVGDLALCLDVTYATVRRWEDGGGAPRTVNLIKLAQLFHTTPDALLEYEMDEPPVAQPVRLWRAK